MRPYGYGGIMRSSFFRNIVGARIARPLLEFVQNFGFAHFLSRNSSILSFAERAILPPFEGENSFLSTV